MRNRKLDLASHVRTGEVGEAFKGVAEEGGQLVGGGVAVLGLGGRCGHPVVQVLGISERKEVITSVLKEGAERS